MKKFSYIVAGKVVTQEGIAMVKTAKLDEAAPLSMALCEILKAAQKLTIVDCGYVPTMAITVVSEDN